MDLIADSTLNIIASCVVIGFAVALTPKLITTKEAIIFSIESTIKSVSQTLTYWKYMNYKSNEMPISALYNKNTTNTGRGGKSHLIYNLCISIPDLVASCVVFGLGLNVRC